MGHLKPDELTDIAEGARQEDAAPHLATCEECRRRLDDLRSMLAAASEADVPEPSPLFWEHLSARVRESIAAEEPQSVVGILWSSLGWRVPLSVAAVAGVVLAAVLTLDIGHRSPPAHTPARDATMDAAAIADDPSLDLVADLTADIDWDSPGDLGLPLEGSAERAVVQMTDDERVELHRLLEAELKGPGN